MKIVKVLGLASQKMILELEIRSESQNKSLLEILQNHKIPIASSCMGDGQCQKCIIFINSLPQLSCTTNVNGLEDETIVGVSYL